MVKREINMNGNKLLVVWVFLLVFLVTGSSLSAPMETQGGVDDPPLEFAVIPGNPL